MCACFCTLGLKCAFFFTAVRFNSFSQLCVSISFQNVGSHPFLRFLFYPISALPPLSDHDTEVTAGFGALVTVPALDTDNAQPYSFRSGPKLFIIPSVTGQWDNYTPDTSLRDSIAPHKTQRSSQMFASV